MIRGEEKVDAIQWRSLDFSEMSCLEEVYLEVEPLDGNMIEELFGALGKLICVRSKPSQVIVGKEDTVRVNGVKKLQLTHFEMLPYSDLFFHWSELDHLEVLEYCERSFDNSMMEKLMEFFGIIVNMKSLREIRIRVEGYIQFSDTLLPALLKHVDECNDTVLFKKLETLRFIIYNHDPQREMLDHFAPLIQSPSRVLKKFQKLKVLELSFNYDKSEVGSIEKLLKQEFFKGYERVICYTGYRPNNPKVSEMELLSRRLNHKDYYSPVQKFRVWCE